MNIERFYTDTRLLTKNHTLHFLLPIVTNDALVAHNNLRRIHNAPDLVLDAGMVAEAEEVAKRNAQSGFLQHTQNLQDEGENLAFNCLPENQVAKIQDSVGDW